MAMHALIAGVKSTYINENCWTIEDYKRDKQLAWNHHFNLDQWDKEKFKYTICTDGVAVSISFEKILPKLTKTQEKNASILKNQLLRTKFENEFFDRAIGVDHGLKRTAAGTKIFRPLLYNFDHRIKDDINNHENIKISSYKFRAITRERQRKHKFFKYTRHQLKSLTQQHREYYQETESISNKDGNYVAYTRFHLRHFTSLQNNYGKRKVARIKFEKYINTQIGVNEMANLLVGKSKAVAEKTLMIVGNYRTAANSPMRGYSRTPTNKLMEALEKKCTIHIVDERNTTKLCSRCFQLMELPRQRKGPNQKYHR